MYIYIYICSVNDICSIEHIYIYTYTQTLGEQLEGLRRTRGSDADGERTATARAIESTVRNNKTTKTSKTLKDIHK